MELTLYLTDFEQAPPLAPGGRDITELLHFLKAADSKVCSEWSGSQDALSNLLIYYVGGGSL